MFTKEQKMQCDYCGKIREQMMFIIGAALNNDIDWIMHEGTGKISCTNPDCRAKAETEAGAIIAAM